MKNKLTTTENHLMVISPDENLAHKYPLYQYSDELFDWFYSRLKYQDGPNGLLTWEAIHIDIEATRRDNSENGIRIWLRDGGYIKLNETTMLISVSEYEMDDIMKCAIGYEVKLSDLINYYYKTHKKLGIVK